VGIETGDDAAVLRVAPDVGIVSTLDFFAPVVDDAYDYGRIAAANAISDVYAMGGRPVMALAIVGLPLKQLPLEVGAEILRGGAAVCADAGIPLAGGHSVDDAELKFGLAVTGVVHPDRILTNRAARDGDLLVLTKPLGIGTMATALKAGLLGPEGVAELVRVTTFLNRAPSEAAVEVGVHAATDVTGFGVVGHLGGMARASGCVAEVWYPQVPVIPFAHDCIAAGKVPGATRRNLAHWGPLVAWDPALPAEAQTVLADPQTSGGLVLSVAPDRVDALLNALRARGALTTAVIGRMRARRPDDAPDVALDVRASAPSAP
jgi:selenide,water dikinase